MLDLSSQVLSLVTGKWEREAVPTGVSRLRHRSWGPKSSGGRPGGTGTGIKQLLLVKDEGSSTTNDLLKQQA